MPNECTDAALPTSQRQKRPLGVLFVHGIGDQPRGETLQHFADPIVRCLNLWIKGVARIRAQTLKSNEADRWARSMPSKVNQKERSMARRVDAWQLASDSDPMNQLMSKSYGSGPLVSEVWSGAAVLRDGLLPFAGTTANFPPHAVLDMHYMNQTYAVTEATVLFAESWWAQSFVPPSPSALFGWILKILPLAVGMHIGDIVRRQAANAGDRGNAVWRRTLAGIGAIIATIAIPVLLPLTILLQALLSVTALLALIPIPGLQQFMRAVQGVLTGTLGDSYLLSASPVSRSTMVGQFRRDLNWLSNECEKVMIVAHSQGCAVSFLGLCEAVPKNLESVTWLGSGIRKLDRLSDAERNMSLLFAGWFVAIAPLGLYLLQPWQSEVWSLDSAFALVIALGYLIGILVLGSVMLINRTAAVEAAKWVEFLKALRVQFFDVFARHDPVPNGSLFDDARNENLDVNSQEVRNRDSEISDHTTYWTNLEEVVMPLALRISRSAGIPVDSLCDGDAKWLRRAQHRRVLRVRVLIGLRLAFVLAVGLAIWTTPEPWRNLFFAVVDAICGWVAASGPDAALKPSLFAAGPHLLAALLVFIGLVTAWRAWDLHEQRCFLDRAAPNRLILFGIAWAVSWLLLVPWCVALVARDGSSYTATLLFIARFSLMGGFLSWLLPAHKPEVGQVSPK